MRLDAVKAMFEEPTGSGEVAPMPAGPIPHVPRMPAGYEPPPLDAANDARTGVAENASP